MPSPRILLAAAALASAASAADWGARVTLAPFDIPVSRLIELEPDGRMQCIWFQRYSNTVTRQRSGIPAAALLTGAAGPLANPDFRKSIEAIRPSQAPIEGDILAVTLLGTRRISAVGVLNALPAPVQAWISGLGSACDSLPAAPLAKGYVRTEPVTGERRAWIASRGGKFVDVRKIPPAGSVVLTEASRDPGRFVPVDAATAKVLGDARSTGEYVIVNGAVHQWTLFVTQ